MCWKCKVSSKNNENYFSDSVPISGGCGWALIFYIINVITAVGGAMGDGRHYNTYYVNIAWEWFLCVFSVCFWIGCKWIKKGGLCARGWENRELFFIDLLCENKC